MNINSDTKLYCLLGKPVTRSLSPMIHNLFFKINTINARYLAFDIKNGYELVKAIEGIKALGIQGFNVTIPYKIEVIKHLDELDEKAQILGAVNTVVNHNGKLKGFNTDGYGFVKSILDIGINLNNKSVVLVGAGGAAHSIAVSIANEKVKDLVIINRTLENAYKLKQLVETHYPLINVSCYEMGDERDIPNNIDMLVNTTSVGMYPDINSIPISPNLFSKDTLFYDIIYKPKKTKLIIEAEKQGCKTLNGLDMLINQAIYSQKVWNKTLLNENIDWNYIKTEISKIIAETS